MALRIRSNLSNRHKDQRHAIPKKIPITSYCADVQVEIRYVVQTHVSLLLFTVIVRLSLAALNFFFCKSVVDRILN